jgi:hypothetical protein
MHLTKPDQVPVPGTKSPTVDCAPPKLTAFGTPSNISLTKVSTLWIARLHVQVPDLASSTQKSSLKDKLLRGSEEGETPYVQV